jgi:two-component system sensor histidine kinase PilS (NtrC family)
MSYRALYLSNTPEFSVRVAELDELPEGDVELRFDRGHLYRVLWNLLGNALRHASPADGAVRLEARAATASTRPDSAWRGNALIHA